ncbi:MAG: UbiA family prenyltransferase [Desulfovibrionaceae bacterium]|jgi:4-hydroxybenzoate polyprenyltransferase|nr:UbiA family prenyltransferase [Desulfovibrionaceae bacterium]
MSKTFSASLRDLLRMVKIEHSVFALPFAYAGAFLAADSRGLAWPGWRAFLLLTLAMVAVRSFAMGFNRVADRAIDTANPRTQNRELVTGAISVGAARAFVAGCGAVFVLACAALNATCLALSPVALALCAVYSYTKRFTRLCHFVLGAVLGLAPLAGWLAVAPDIAGAAGAQALLPALLLFCGVLFWVAGFDILYACQDVDFDRSRGLHSLPARTSLETALALSTMSHAVAAIFFLLAGASAALAWPYYAVWAAVSAVLLWEHRIIGPEDMSRVNVAFFTMNGVISVALFGGVLLALYA